jgi:hypothetical protein
MGFNSAFKGLRLSAALSFPSIFAGTEESNVGWQRIIRLLRPLKLKLRALCPLSVPQELVVRFGPPATLQLNVSHRKA